MRNIHYAGSSRPAHNGASILLHIIGTFQIGQVKSFFNHMQFNFAAELKESPPFYAFLLDIRPFSLDINLLLVIW
ncbi:MAG: hypothetical protein ACREIP_20435, partial [Alphaproteobacteria bacterium]